MTIAVAILVVFAIAGGFWLGVDPVEKTVPGAPRAAGFVGRSDEDQIGDVLQAISDAYNHKDVKSAEGNLCAHVRSQWNARLENVWMTYRLRHGTADFTITSIDVRGAAADVTGRQSYTNDVHPHDFTALMGRGTGGWKMCSST